MDINLFSKCIKDLILENDRVEIPFLGVFTAEMQPAGYSDKQTTINPPYRKMSFHKGDVSLEQGKLLLGKVMKESGVSLEQAGVELGWCLSRLSSELEGRKSCKLPGLGTMRANARNEFFFVPDDDIDIWPDGIGFEPISIRVSEKPLAEEPELEPAVEEEPQPVVEEIQPEPVVEEPQPVVEEIQPAPVAEEIQHAVPAVEEPQAPAPAVHHHSVSASHHGHKHHHHRREESTGRKLHPAWIVVIVLAVLIALFVAASYIFTDRMSPILDRLLYSKEELELMRYFGGK